MIEERLLSIFLLYDLNENNVFAYGFAYRLGRVLFFSGQDFWVWDTRRDQLAIQTRVLGLGLGLTFELGIGFSLRLKLDLELGVSVGVCAEIRYPSAESVAPHSVI